MEVNYAYKGSTAVVDQGDRILETLKKMEEEETEE